MECAVVLGTLSNLRILIEKEISKGDFPLTNVWLRRPVVT